MTREVVFRPEAETEVLDVQRWYASRRDGLGEEFGTAVDAVVAPIAENALAFPRVHGESAEPFSPVSLTPRTAGERLVVVLAVHGRQDPSRWQKRKTTQVR